MAKRTNGKSADPPALIALRRSAKAALELARQTGTACWVMKNGKIIDIAKSKPQPSKTAKPKPKPSRSKPAKSKSAPTKLARRKPAKNGRPASKRK